MVIHLARPSWHRPAR